MYSPRPVKIIDSLRQSGFTHCSVFHSSFVVELQESQADTDIITLSVEEKSAQFQVTTSSDAGDVAECERNPTDADNWWSALAAGRMF